MKRLFAAVVTVVLGSLVFSAPAEAVSYQVSQKTLTPFSGSVTTLTAKQKAEVKAAVDANPEAEKFICTGIRYESDPTSVNIMVRARAKAACAYAKELNPKLSTWYQNKPTKAKSYSGKVLLTVKSTGQNSNINLSPGRNSGSTVSTEVRSNQNRIDDKIGFQIQFVYVVPSDQVDRNIDINGTMSRAIEEGNNFLKNQIGRTFRTDTFEGAYDILYFKSEYSSTYIANHPEPMVLLYDELNLQMQQKHSFSRKLYSIWVEVDAFYSGHACGVASSSFGAVHVVAAGTKCAGSDHQFSDNRSSAWVHETLHNLGVKISTGDGCEYMSHKQCNEAAYRIDPNNEFYVGTTTAVGSDILQLGVWDSQNAGKFNYCDTYSKTLTAFCSAGEALIGPPQYLWSKFSEAKLFEISGGVRQVVGVGTQANKPWSTYAQYTCDYPYVCPSVKITQTNLGPRIYQWEIDGNMQDRFTIYWQK